MPVAYGRPSGPDEHGKSDDAGAGVTGAQYVRGVGITHIDAVVRGPKAEAAVRLLVDTGAGYTLLPHDVWQQIGLEPRRSELFSLADGTQIERQMSYCEIRLPEGEGPTPVILGEADDTGLLGVVTLEELGFVFNPFTRSLHPMRMLLASAS